MEGIKASAATTRALRYLKIVNVYIFNATFITYTANSNVIITRCLVISASSRFQRMRDTMASTIGPELAQKAQNVRLRPRNETLYDSLFRNDYAATRIPENRVQTGALGRVSRVFVEQKRLRLRGKPATRPPFVRGRVFISLGTVHYDGRWSVDERGKVRRAARRTTDPRGRMLS